VENWELILFFLIGFIMIAIGLALYNGYRMNRLEEILEKQNARIKGLETGQTIPWFLVLEGSGKPEEIKKIEYKEETEKPL
jgi:hypothetical protein